MSEGQTKRDLEKNGSKGKRGVWSFKLVGRWNLSKGSRNKVREIEKLSQLSRWEKGDYEI